MKKKSKKHLADKVKEKTAEYLAVSSSKLKNQYAVIIEQDEDGFFVASVPSLPGCHTQGKTLPQLRENIKDAIRLCLSVADEDPQYKNKIKKMAYQPSFIAMELISL